MTIVETYSVGIPVICPDMGNVESVVINGITGWKFRDKEGLIKRIEKLVLLVF